MANFIFNTLYFRNLVVNDGRSLAQRSLADLRGDDNAFVVVWYDIFACPLYVRAC